MLCVTPEGIALTQQLQLQKRLKVGNDGDSLVPDHESPAETASRARAATARGHAPPGSAEPGWHWDDKEDLQDADLDKLPDDPDDDGDEDNEAAKSALPSPAAMPGHKLPDGSPIPGTLGGHRTQRHDFGVTRDHVNLHGVVPTNFVNLATVEPGSVAGSSFAGDPGHVSLQLLNQAHAASAKPLPGSPSGDPSARKPFGTAPTGKKPMERRGSGPAALMTPGQVGQ